MSIASNLVYTFRSLRKSPAFTATAVVTLALGIGATTAVFSVCDAMLWKPIPLPHMEALAMVLQRVPGDPNDWNSATPADIRDIGAQAAAFQGLASYQQGLANIAGGIGEPDRVDQAMVSANFFDVLGVQPALGRGFRPGEDQPGREREIIFSDSYWRNRFAADPKIIGQTIRVDDQDYTVTGVMPPKFDFPLATEVWTPLALQPKDSNSRTAQTLMGVARLRAGRSLDQAASEIDAIGRRLEAQYPDTNKNRRFRVMSATDFLVGFEDRQYTLLLLWAVMFVLLIACVNVANLQFARSSGKLREIAVRTALGAGRMRLIAQLLTESVALAMGGALAGIAVAYWGLNMIRAGMPPRIGKYIVGWQEIHIDLRTLSFMLAAAAASGILAGLAPAWQCSRPNLIEALRDGGRGSSSGRARRRLRAMLVGAEIAIAVMLLVGAGLMVRGFRALVQGAARLEPSTMLALRLTLTETKYRENYRVAAFYRQILERLNALPGVQSAVAVTALPYSGHSSGRDFTIEGRPVERGSQPHCMYQVVSARYFETLHIPLVRGRLLNTGDGADSLRVGVISDRMARRFWPNESPIGKRIKLGPPDSKSPWITVAGVVGDVTHDTYDRNPRATLYVPLEQLPGRWMDIGVRATGDPFRLAPAVTAAIRSIDAEQPITRMTTLETWMHEQSVGLNYMAVLMGVFGALALVLSSVGIYGVMAYVVAEQTQEIGIRMALGAGRASVLGMVYRRGVVTVAAGLAIGMVMAYAFSRLIASLIYGVSASDAATFIGIPLTLIASAALAIYIPARRAMRIDPIVALRYE